MIARRGLLFRDESSKVVSFCLVSIYCQNKIKVFTVFRYAAISYFINYQFEVDKRSAFFVDLLFGNDENESANS